VARIVCQVLHRPDRVTFIWSQGSASFSPYHLLAEKAETFRQLGRQARERLADVATHGPASASGLAQVGWQLYQMIFPREPVAAEIQGWLNDLRSKNSVESLEIVSDLPGTTPWNVVCEQAPDEGALAAGQPAAFQPFWGVRYPLTNGRRVNAWRQVPFLESPIVLLAADPNLLQQLPEEQRNRLTNFARDKQLPLIDTKRALAEAVQDQPPDFLYVFCRAHPHGFMLGSDVVSLSEFRSLVRGGETEPLVFLNVAGMGRDSSSYMGQLLAIGLDGAIATEQPAPAAEANALGLELLADFVYGGKPLGAALQTLRARSGLAGLLLSSSCPAHLRIVWEEPAGGSASDESDLSSLTPRPFPLPDYPYRPLAPYDREDRALFAGREEDVAEFVGRLDRAETRMLILHGVSGVGKASFLHAGVVPYLEDEAIGFQALRDRTPEDEPRDEQDYPVIAIRATHDLAGQLAEALCAFCGQPYQFTSPTGKTTSVDVSGILQRLVAAQEQGTSLSTAVRELGPEDQIQPAGGGLSGPPPLPPSEHGGGDEEITPVVVWEALQNDPGLLARLLTALSEPLPGELVLLVEQGEEVFTQVTRPVDRRRRRQALDMLSRAAATPGQFKLIYSLRTEFLGRLLDDVPAQANGPNTFLLGELDDDRILEAILLPTVAESIPFSDEVPQEKYRFSYAEGIPQTIVRNARSAGNGSESLLPRVQAICAQLFDMLGERPDRVIGEPDLKALGKGEQAFRLSSYVEKKLAFLPLRSDRRRFVELLQHFYRREPDGTVVRKLVPLAILTEYWRGSVPLNAVVESAAAENVRIFELNQLLIGGKESLYVSLSQDALAQAAYQLGKKSSARPMAGARWWTCSGFSFRSCSWWR
jgi:hypothetical protein